MKSKNYLFEELDKGRSLSVLLLSHNAYWPDLQRIEPHYKNFNLTFTGGSILYLEMTRRPIKYDFDLILFFGNSFYEEKELLKLKEIAFDISEKEDKRVTIGYSYIIPKEERQYKEISEEVKLVSFKDSKEIEETTYGIEYFNPQCLAQMTLVTHDNLDKQKTFIKK